MPYVAPARAGSMTPLEAYIFRVQNGNYAAPTRTRGMGQDGSSDQTDQNVVTGGIFGTTPTNPLFNVPLSGVISPVESTGIAAPVVTDTSGNVVPNPLNAILSDFGINTNTTPSVTTTSSGQSTTTPTTASGLAQLMTAISGGAANAVKLYQQIQGPSLVAGTNAIYNPTTGQYYNPTTGQVVSPTGATTGALGTQLASMLPNILLIGGIILGGFLAIRAVEGAS